MRFRISTGRLPGYVATGLVVFVTSAWTLWGVAEMYYEGWWGSPANRLPYLVPAVCCLALTLLAITWPRFGGWLIVGIGGVFTLWWWSLSARRGLLTTRTMVGTFPVSGLLVLTGALFLLEGRRRRVQEPDARKSPERWVRRNVRYGVAGGAPLVVALAISAYWLPIVLTRTDDGDHGARLIAGNGVELVWAPEGPGWSGPRPGATETASGLAWPRHLSWNDIALYGMAPVGFGSKAGCQDRDASTADMEATGLCRYLSEDGLSLMEQLQGFWRMPTTDEIVRSLVRDGVHAGCAWDGVSQSARCDVTPDKETPLWIPGWAPIYYWSTDQYDEHEAYYVSYHGSIISYQPKSWSNSRHGYRCVREP